MHGCIHFLESPHDKQVWLRQGCWCTTAPRRRWFLSLRVWASGCRRARAQPTSCRRSPRARTSASTGQTPPSPTASFPPPKWRAHSITPLSARPLPPKPPLPLCTPRKVCCSWHKISGYFAYWYSIRWCLGQDVCHISQSVVQGRCHGFPLLGITGNDGEHFSKKVECSMKH